MRRWLRLAVHFARLRERRAALLALWLIDVAVNAHIPTSAQLCNGVWCWPTTVVYHGALWTLGAIALLAPEPRW